MFIGEVKPMDIKIVTSQIKEVFMITQLVEGKSRLPNYFKNYNCLEGKPVIERIGNGEYRLITCYENYEFYLKHKPSFPFESFLMNFKNDNERYIELLRQLILRKARSRFSEKYIIIQYLRISFSLKEIANYVGVPTYEIRRLTFVDNKYKPYLEHSIEIKKKSVMEELIRILNSELNIKEQTETYLLNLIISSNPVLNLTKNNLQSVRTILFGIRQKFNELTPDDQITIINEIVQLGTDVLIQYFSRRCDELLEGDDLD